MNTIYDTIIIGAGQAGLTTGYYLQQAGLKFAILEAGNEPAGSWPRYYDSLLLNSSARYSSLPGLPFPGHPQHYPTRDEVVAYLRYYAAHFSLPVITGAWVSNVVRVGKLFRVTTAGPGYYLARAVVAATGFFGNPYIPDLPGQNRYRGQMLHMAGYRNPEPFRGRRVVIVGGANGAVQIGVELAQVAQVTLATRQPLRYLPQRLLGQDVHFWLRLTGLDETQWLNEKSMPVYDAGKFRAMIAAGRPDRRPLIQSFTEDGVIWRDGRHEKVDAVIFATGYRPHLPYLTRLGALDRAGRVLQRNGVSATVPGLYFVGLPRQRSVASATLRGVGADAKVVATHLQRYCRSMAQKSGSPTLAQQAQAWLSRSGQLVGLISLMTLALKQQRGSAPRLMGEALVHSFIVGAGFFGVGNGAALYRG